MSAKSFSDSPALAYISSAHEDTQEGTHEDTQEVRTAGPDGAGKRRPYVRTQGRKGRKKPRINLAFDSDEFLGEVRARAGQEGMSVTQLVNIAVAHYLDGFR